MLAIITIPLILFVSRWVVQNGFISVYQHFMYLSVPSPKGLMIIFKRIMNHKIWNHKVIPFLFDNLNPFCYRIFKQVLCGLQLKILRPPQMFKNFATWMETLHEVELKFRFFAT